MIDLTKYLSESILDTDDLDGDDIIKTAFESAYESDRLQYRFPESTPVDEILSLMEFKPAELILHHEKYALTIFRFGQNILKLLQSMGIKLISSSDQIEIRLYLGSEGIKNIKFEIPKGHIIFDPDYRRTYDIRNCDIHAQTLNIASGIINFKSCNIQIDHDQAWSDDVRIARGDLYTDIPIKVVKKPTNVSHDLCLNHYDGKATECLKEFIKAGYIIPNPNGKGYTAPTKSNIAKITTPLDKIFDIIEWNDNTFIEMRMVDINHTSPNMLCWVYIGKPWLRPAKQRGYTQKQIEVPGTNFAITYVMCSK